MTKYIIYIKFQNTLTSKALRMSSLLLYKINSFRFPFPGAKRTFLMAPLEVGTILKQGRK